MTRASRPSLPARIALGTGLALALGIGAWAWSSRSREGPLAAAERAYENGAWKSAASEARRILKAQPDRADALVMLARTEARLGRAEAARNLYRRLDPQGLRAEDYFLVGRGLVAEGQIDEGTRGLERALEIDPGNSESLMEKIRIDRQTDRLAEAGELAARLAAIPAHEVRGLVLQGMVLQAQKDLQAAAQMFRKALSRDPQLAGVAETSPDEVRKWLIRGLLQAGKADEARAELDDSLRSQPDDPELNWLLSRAALLQRDLPTARGALGRSSGFNVDHPEAIEPAPFVGITRCQDCHARIFRDQRASRHAQTFHSGSDLLDLPLPDRPLPDPARPEVSHELSSRSDGVAYDAHTPEGDLQAIVQFVLGSGDRAMTLVGRDAQGGWKELRMTYYGTDATWDRTPGHERLPSVREHFLGLPQDADVLRRCLSCHTTRARLGPSGEITANAGERGFDCERCHGPAGNHLAAIDTHFNDPAIARPRLASATALNALCGQCHSAQGRGVSKDDPNMARFQVTSLALSRCATSSGEPLSCLACHNPHRNAEKSPVFYEAKCLECHGAGIAARSSSRACPVDSSKGCVSCHMPSVQTDVPHVSFTDHRIRVIQPRRPQDGPVKEHVSPAARSIPGPGISP